MKYNFDEIVDRRGTNSVKWDLADEGVIPMWVADMDFKAAPCITERIRKRLENGVLGYMRPPKRYFDDVVQWYERRHGLHVEPDWILMTPGVVPAVSVGVKAMTSPGDKVLIHTPVYNCFFSSIRNNDCEVCESPLVWDGETYTVDWEDFEAKAADPKVKVFILCNPHNPAGRVWTREELSRMGEICIKNDVFVIADEIHNEIVAPGYKYVPFASISEDFLLHSATCCSPTKGFNIAGIHVSNIFVSDEQLRAHFKRVININEVCDLNVFSVEGLMAAYEEGEEWLEQMNAYVHGNYLRLKEWVEGCCPKLKLAKLEGTYLAWLDCSSICDDTDVLEKTLYKDAKVWLNRGSMYGEAGRKFLRINLACPRSVLDEALERILPILS